MYENSTFSDENAPQMQNKHETSFIWLLENFELKAQYQHWWTELGLLDV